MARLWVYSQFDSLDSVSNTVMTCDKIRHGKMRTGKITCGMIT